MEGSQIVEMMGELRLFGMRMAYDEIMANAIKRDHEPPRIVGDLLKSEIAEKLARSIKYQMTITRLPLAKDIEDFDFTKTPINESLVRDLTSGSFIAEQRDAVLIGGTGTGKPHLAIDQPPPGRLVSNKQRNWNARQRFRFGGQFGGQAACLIFHII